MKVQKIGEVPAEKVRFESLVDGASFLDPGDGNLCMKVSGTDAFDFESNMLLDNWDYVVPVDSRVQWRHNGSIVEGSQ
jgi:hypothetical protein